MATAQKKSIPILAFHKVDSAFEWSITRTKPRQFRKILAYLSKQGYASISLQQLVNPTSNLPEKPIILTFDDSYESIFLNAFPIMQEYGFTGTIFIITGFVGKKNIWDINWGGLTFSHLSWEQILQMKKSGFEFGSHTVHHQDLTRIDRETLEWELLSSKQSIENHLEEEISFLSFPFGRFNEDVIAIARSCGYLKGCGFCFSTNEKKIKETFVLERKACYLFEGLTDVKAKVNHTFLTPFENLKLHIVNKCSIGTTLVKPSAFSFEKKFPKDRDNI